MEKTEWTILTLKEHLESRLDSQERGVATALTAAKEAVAAAMAAAEKAVTKAEIATEKRLEGVNEFRASLSDQQGTFVRQDVADTRFKAVEALIAGLIARDNEKSASDRERTGRSTGISTAWGFALSALSAVSVVLAIAAFFLKG